MRKKIAAGNWKMNKFFAEGLQLAADLLVALEREPPAHTVVVCPPFIHLSDISKMLKGSGFMSLGAQNCHASDSGAFTGEVSAAMLASLGVDYVIAGHSERRQLFGETDDLVAAKVKAILAHGMRPIFCCGEPLDVRRAGGHFDYVKAQAEAALMRLAEDEMQRTVIAYEPIWAIGTGATATPEQAQEMHAFIRSLLAAHFGSETAAATTVLYGGSVNAANAASLFSRPDVDGGLIGGASLQAADFVKIIRSLPR
jgi:triosephosphate isomerase